MAVDVDYYAVLGVDRKAKPEEIQDAVKRSMREWRKRTEAADISVRQEAEIKVKHIEEARTLLLDEAKRTVYDLELGQGVKQPELNVAPTGNDDWLERALGYLAMGDYHSAAYAAGEATRTVGNNAKCWWVRSRADAGLGKWQEALFEANEAARLEENNADYHFNLGCVCEEMKKWHQALQAFTRASNLQPEVPLYQLAVGSIYLQMNAPDKALAVIEAVQRKHSQDQSASTYLVMALVDVAEAVPKRRIPNGYVITSAEEIARMKPLLHRAQGLHLASPEVKEGVAATLKYIAEMEKMTFRFPPFMAGLAAGAFDGGIGVGCMGLVILGAIYFLPLILIISGFNAMGAGSVGGGLLLLLIGGGLGFGWWKYTYVPRWKKNV